MTSGARSLAGTPGSSPSVPVLRVPLLSRSIPIEILPPVCCPVPGISRVNSCFGSSDLVSVGLSPKILPSEPKLTSATAAGGLSVGGKCSAAPPRPVKVVARAAAPAITPAALFGPLRCSDIFGFLELFAY